jgi:hypothetical protein
MEIGRRGRVARMDVEKRVKKYWEANQEERERERETEREKKRM